MAQNSANQNKEAHDLEKKKTKIYLNFIAEALNELSGNQGTLRKDIWQYLLDKDPKQKTINYVDFLKAIQNLLTEGKLLNDVGSFKIQDDVYKAMKYKPSKIKSKSNFLASDKARANQTTLPYTSTTTPYNALRDPVDEGDSFNRKGGTVAGRAVYQPCRQVLLDQFVQQRGDGNQPNAAQGTAEQDQERRPILGLQTPSDAQTFGTKPV